MKNSLSLSIVLETIIKSVLLQYECFAFSLVVMDDDDDESCLFDLIG